MRENVLVRAMPRMISVINTWHGICTRVCVHVHWSLLFPMNALLNVHAVHVCKRVMRSADTHGIRIFDFYVMRLLVREYLPRRQPTAESLEHRYSS